MKVKKTKFFLKISLAFLVLILSVAVGMSLWLYKGQMTPEKSKIFSLAPLPMAFVGGRNIPVSAFLQRYAIAQKILASQGAQVGDSQTKSNIYNQLINETKNNAIAAKYGVGVTQGQMDAEYRIESAQPGFAQTLQNYGASQSLFENYIIKPRQLAVNLQIWFNSQANLNPQLYQQANALLQKIQSGQDMGVLAASASQDPISRPVAGDLGFVDVSRLLPELREAVAGMKTGDVKILSSRYGLHIIKLEDVNGNQLHLRQIFLANPNFENWYKLQAQNIKIEKLISL